MVYLPRTARRLCLACLLAALLSPGARGQERLRVAVFDIAGDGGVADALTAALAGDGRLALLDPALVRSAARGTGYTGSLNLSREEARRLGAVAGADALVLGLASIVERQASDGSRTGDAFLALFLVDGRTGSLLRYRGVEAEGPDPGRAREVALEAARAELATWGDHCREAADQRARIVVEDAPAGEVVDLVTNTDAPGLRPPRFFRRPVPAMTVDAERVRVEATVDLIVDFNADGTYGPIEVARWAGLGLDEAAAAAVRNCRFWPAERGGVAVPCRATLRFNFRVRQ